MLAAKWQRILIVVPVLGVVQFAREFSSGAANCDGASLPLAKIVAALVGPSALGWLISPAGIDGARGLALRRRRCATMRGRSNTTIGLAAANAEAPKSSCLQMAAKALQGGLTLSNMPMKLTKAGQLFPDDCLAGAARPLR